MRHVPDDVVVIQRNGRIFFAHPFRRYDALTAFSGKSGPAGPDPSSFPGHPDFVGPPASLATPQPQKASFLEQLSGAAPLFGTITGISSTLLEGKEAERLAGERAAVDLRNAQAVREAAEEEAKIRGERGRRILETITSRAAASNIRVNVGVPLVARAEARAAIAKDIGFGLQRGRVESAALRERARLEKETGKAARRRSKFDAISQGIKGFGSIAFMGTR